MQKRATKCSASGVPLTEVKSTSFPCPICGEPIGRSERCRNQAVTYYCPAEGCDFQGP
ncbi:MAG: RNA-binding protein [Euryarchaeota archaeon]|nr:RNA-binding protein [Euryarchaeota archaeon]